MIYAIGIFVSFFLALLLLSKKGRNVADTILGIWMVVIGLHLFAYYSMITGLIYTYTYLIGLNLPFPFLHGPFLYLYTLALTNPGSLKSRVWLVNLLLPLAIVSSTISFLLLPVEQKIYVYQHNGEGYETYMLVVNVLLSASGIIYIYLTNRLLLRHRKRILDEFSDQENINLNWLRFLFYGMGLIWVFVILNLSDEWIFTLAVFFVILIGYFGIRQVGIFANQPLPPGNDGSKNEVISVVETEESDPEKRKYAKSGLNDDSAKALHERLKTLMHDRKLYREPELTLVELASQLGIHPNYLSQVINDREGVNFYDYVNGLRIEEFKKEIARAENRKYTLLAVAYDCGFNSKSSFNRFFKKAEGKSPTEYLKALNFPVSTSIS